MSEFKNRMAAQRAILSVVNSRPRREELFGLSNKAIARWATSNGVSQDSRLHQLIESASSTLFFLANKSQEQISEDYRLASNEIASLAEEIDREID
jgi:hypothetical protein